LSFSRTTTIVGQASRRLPATGFIPAAIVFLSGMVACSAPPAADTSAIALELTRLDDEWSRAAAIKNVDSVASFYAKDAIAYPPNEPMAAGQAAARAIWAAYFADSTFSISWKTVHAGGSRGGDLGFTTGTYEDSFIGADGKRVVERGKYVCVWAKQTDGTWKAIHDTWNADSK
jgi:ketosteroid isomerase-like protein